MLQLRGCGEAIEFAKARSQDSQVPKLGKQAMEQVLGHSAKAQVELPNVRKGSDDAHEMLANMWSHGTGGTIQPSRKDPAGRAKHAT